jgi:signal transduction histidine kinase
MTMSIATPIAPSAGVIPPPALERFSEPESVDQRLVQAQRLDALAHMAGHVAHEYNNLLTTILGFSGLMRRSDHLTTDERDNLGHIDDAAHRAADLTRSLLAFARGGLVSFGPVDLARVVAETLRLAEPTLGSGVRLRFRTPTEPAFIEGDAEQIQQAALNLILNARDALGESGDLTVTILELGEIVRLTIADNGRGMDEETRSRAFEPFFSRKASGPASGLGLSTTYGIVKGHHGTIDMVTAPGEGTTVTVDFPAATCPAEYIRPSDGDLALIGPVDEATLSRAVNLATSLGLTPVLARDAEHAEQLVTARPHRFATAITGRNGDSEAFTALFSSRPGLPLLLCVPSPA